jgi:arsenate reductase (glutaredoxin)
LEDTDLATIWHNPRCGTSRNTLELMREAGLEPEVIEYLKTPPSAAELAALARDLPGGARDLLRAKEALADELGLNDPAASDQSIIDAVAGHPLLLNRPIVRTDKGVRACRPSETVKHIL